MAARLVSLAYCVMDCVCDVLIVYACGLVAKDGVCICARLTVGRICRQPMLVIGRKLRNALLHSEHQYVHSVCRAVRGMCAGLTASGPEVSLLGSTLGVPCILCDGL